MGCFPCFGWPKKNDVRKADDQKPVLDKKDFNPWTDNNVVQMDGSNAVSPKAFTYGELSSATRNFKPDYVLGAGCFGRVYKGRLESTNQIVAIKKLDRNGLQGNKEFVTEVTILSGLHHKNLVNLIGFCVEGGQRLLVYEYMPLGSLEDHLHDITSVKQPLDWNTRMKIAAGAATGLEYLHCCVKPSVIYRDLKCSNILLGEGYHPKLSDFGLAKLGPVGDNTHVSTKVMGTCGYSAPEYAMTGKLTSRSDIYSFGVVLLELITGRRAVDNSQPQANLVAWARPLFRDRRQLTKMVDPVLRGRYPVKGLYRALAIAAMCTQEEPNMRPLTAELTVALNYLAAQGYEPQSLPSHGSPAVLRGPPPPSTRNGFNGEEAKFLV